MKKYDFINRQQGMTLIEVMIAMILGMFLLGGVIQIFLSSQQSYQMQERLSRVQENGRFAMEFISRDIRMAGYQGCALPVATNNIRPRNANPNSRPSTLPAGLSLAILGGDNVTNNWSADACSGTDQCTVGTDSVSYQYGEVCGNLTGNMGSNNANIQLGASAVVQCGLQAFDILLIADCVAADIFIATNVSGGAVNRTIAHAANQNLGPMLSQVYGADAQLFRLKSSTFFIRSGAGGGASLWQMDNAKAAGGANPVELVEGISNMQILYGADTDGNNTPNYYVPAGTAGLNMGVVVSIRIKITSTSGGISREFSSTIALRNRL